MEEQVRLNPLLVRDIKGTFHVPSYQRGYRWGKDEVTQLLNDIEEYLSKDKINDDYYLQPVVVKQINSEKYELIDGQQRLTTIKLIYGALNEVLPNAFDACRYQIEYETRKNTKQFLDDPNNLQLAKTNVDFAYISKAYTSIKEWFEKPQHKERFWLMKFYTFIEEHLRIIWYEIPSNGNSIELFTRLNIGKIPLTNAELIRALIFRGKTDQKKIEWAFRWSMIEEKLQHDNFWGFLTNLPAKSYPNRIELIFDVISQKRKSDAPLDNYTFNYFYDLLTIGQKSQEEVWQNIWDTYNLLYEWFSDNELYHKIGFLVAIGDSLVELKDLYFQNGETPCNKKKYTEVLNETISNKLNITEKDLPSLAYNKPKEKDKILKVLLLFNILETLNMKNVTQLFPFSRHKGKEWSLEHIHAQQDAGLKKEQDWIEWVKIYQSTFEAILENPVAFIEQGEEERNNKKEQAKEILSELNRKIEKGISKEDYNESAAKVGEFFNELAEEEDIHLLSNMALLTIENNSTFNNAPYPVKRKKMLELDKEGYYIPLSTRRVFLKYYTNERVNQMFKWTNKDREEYLKAITATLKPYLKK